MLGPVLLLTHIKDLPKCVSCRIIMSADDTKSSLGINSLVDVDALHQNIDMFRILLKSLVRPILEHCSSVWSPSQQEGLNKSSVGLQKW